MVDFAQCYDEWATITTIDASAQFSEYASLTSDLQANAGTIASLNTLGLDNTNKVVGIALNGVFIFTAISDYGLDPFFPKAFGTKQNVQKVPIDQCLGSTETDSTYRYYMYSPCMFDGVSLRAQAKLCQVEGNYELCSKNPTWHALAYTPNPVKTIYPIGLAKDGKVIYGPYKADGTLWGACDVDICNGRNFDSDHYGYVATMFFPYTVGCWGPGSRGANV